MLTRRRLIAASAVVVLPAPGRALADTWPSKPIKLVVPYAPGGTTDVVGRMIAEYLGRQLGQNIVVENRPGKGATIGTAQVAKAAPDGYTYVFGTAGTHGINASLYKRLSFDVETDFTPIAPVVDVPNVLTVNPKFVDAKDVKQFIEIVKKQPGKLNYGTSGTGTTTHLVAEMFNGAAGIQTSHIPYKGSGLMMNDLVGGQVDMAFDTIATTKPHIDSGSLRAIGATMARRSPAAPEIPTFDEQGLKNFVGGSWVGFLGPANLPAPIVARVLADVTQILNSGLADELTKRGLDPAGLPPEQFAAMIREEHARFTAIGQRAGLKPE